MMRRVRKIKREILGDVREREGKAGKILENIFTTVRDFPSLRRELLAFGVNKTGKVFLLFHIFYDIYINGD